MLRNASIRTDGETEFGCVYDDVGEHLQEPPCSSISSTDGIFSLHRFVSASLPGEDYRTEMKDIRWYGKETGDQRGINPNAQLLPAWYFF